jgi:hypothetical protein
VPLFIPCFRKIASWARTLAVKGGPKAALVALSIDFAYGLLLEKIDFTTAQDKLSAYLQTKDEELTKEQADYLAKKSIKIAQEVGRFSFHRLATGLYSKFTNKFFSTNKQVPRGGKVPPIWRGSSSSVPAIKLTREKARN